MNSPSSHQYRSYFEYLKVQSLFGRIYRRYFLYPHLLKKLGPVFLDVGCGVGLFLSCGSRQSLGLDVNSYCVEWARTQGLNADLIGMDGSFPVHDSSFPAIMCDQVLEHIEDPGFLLSEIDRVLRPNGKVIIGIPLKKGFAADPDHKHPYNLSHLVETVNTYSSLNYSSHFYFPFPIEFFGNFFSWQYLYVVFISRKD